MSERVALSVEDGIAEVRLNRPQRHNGLDVAMFDALVEVGLQVRGRKDVRAVVLSGEGPSFCSGLDFASFMADPSAMAHLLEHPEGGEVNVAQRAAWVWQEVEVPVIAALHGAVYGGGLQIALGADLRYAAPDSRLSVMESRYGLVPDMGLSQTLLRLVRADVAAELVFTARVVDAAEALALGLVTRVVDDPRAAALDTARRMAAGSPHALRACKRLLREAPALSRAAAFALEEALQVELLGSPNQLEAVMAALQKRAPVFADPA